MTTRINERGPEPLIESTRTAPRVTPSPSQPFRSMMQAGARAVVDSAESAVLRLPGGPVLAAAFRPGPTAMRTTSSPLSVDSGDSSSLSAEGPSTTSDPELLAGSGGDMMTQNAEQNMYYLRLQEQISAESRQYTALSNVLKARHDMVKNAIGNIR